MKDEFLSAVDEDTEAFNQVMACFRMPKATPEEQKAKEAAIQEATKQATLVPLGVLLKVPSVLDLAEVVAARGNQNSLSDAGVAVSMCRSAAQGAYMNVLINLKGLCDIGFTASVAGQARKTLAEVEQRCDRLTGEVFGRLSA